MVVATEQRTGTRVEHPRRHDTFIGAANIRFGRLVGAEISHQFTLPSLVFADGGDRFAVHMHEHIGDSEGAIVVMQRVEMYHDGLGMEELRLGHIPGKPFSERITEAEKDGFFEGLASVIKDPEAKVDASELRVRLLAVHPFLEEVA